MNIKLKFENLLRSSSGVMAPLIVMLLPVTILFCGLSVDIGYFSILRSNLEKASEAASIAGAREYFLNGADAGMAINLTTNVFRMNVTNGTVAMQYHNDTGAGQPETLTYTRTFTEADSLNNIYRGSNITFTTMTDLERGKITVTSSLTPKPFFSQAITGNSTISITREAELPPYDVVFVVDLSGSMRFATFNTYIGTASRRLTSGGMSMSYNDVILYQGQEQSYGNGDVIMANGYNTTITSIDDVVVNSPGTDIPTDATYSDGTSVYISDSDRGYIVNTENSTNLHRFALSGYRVSELSGLGVSMEDQGLAQSYSDNQSNDSATLATYFDRAANYIEPAASATFGVMTFIDTVKTYGASALQIGLVTFESDASTSDSTSTITSSELQGGGSSKRLSRTRPYIMLVEPASFDSVYEKLTVKSLGGIGTMSDPLITYSYPEGGTNINAGLDDALTTLNNSTRTNPEKVIILFTDGEPTSHSFTALGNKILSLTESGIKVYSIVLTLAIDQDTIDDFSYQVETRGMAEPVVFINDPARLKDAFKQIATDLGLKLVD